MSDDMTKENPMGDVVRAKELLREAIAAAGIEKAHAIRRQAVWDDGPGHTMRLENAALCAIEAALALARPALSPNTDALVGELGELLAKATPGPWKLRRGYYLSIQGAPKDERYGELITTHTGQIAKQQSVGKDNAALIVAAINALPYLLTLAKAPVSEDVIQADRIAAADMIASIMKQNPDAYAANFDKCVREGMADAYVEVESFRRHRLGLTTEREGG